MRVIAGALRGRKLVAPKGNSTRPTADRTRETLFNMLTSRLGSFGGLRVADLFAGSGALGIEAISRGAAQCLFVEEDKSAIDSLRKNIESLEIDQSTKVECASVMRLGPMRQPFDLILLDPPYGTGAGCVALDRLLRLGWVAPHCWIALETSANEAVEVKGLSVEAERRVGKAKLTLMTQQVE